MLRWSLGLEHSYSYEALHPTKHDIEAAWLRANVALNIMAH